MLGESGEERRRSVRDGETTALGSCEWPIPPGRVSSTWPLEFALILSPLLSLRLAVLISGMADPSNLQAEIGDVNAKISRLESKEERLEAALGGNGSFLGTTDHVCFTDLY